MIDGEKMRHLAKLLLITNIITFVAFITVGSFAAQSKSLLKECHAQLETIH